MPTKLETQAAEAKCPVCGDKPHGEGHLCQCDDCEGTGLRYQNLSRECECILYLKHGEHDWLGCKPCSACQDKASHSDECIFGDGSVRVPAGDLGTVLELLLKPGTIGDKTERVVFVQRDYGYGCWSPGELVSKGDTPKEAALAALLSSETPATPARKPPTPE